MNRIEIKGIRGHGFHGVLTFERTEGQEFLVDVAMEVATEEAAKHDDLLLTVDYSAIAQLVHARIIGEPHQLIETLAHRIADDLAKVPRVEAVTVAVHKPHAPIPVPFDDVVVTVHRLKD
ncbi:MAG: dihydroneopterin aldolase [Candidatus Nanopelagicales bacterium]